jgi:hypothetical protein
MEEVLDMADWLLLLNWFYIVKLALFSLVFFWKKHCFLNNQVKQSCPLRKEEGEPTANTTFNTWQKPPRRNFERWFIGNEIG